MRRLRAFSPRSCRLGSVKAYQPAGEIHGKAGAQADRRAQRHVDGIDAGGEEIEHLGRAGPRWPDGGEVERAQHHLHAGLDVAHVEGERRRRPRQARRRSRSAQIEQESAAADCSRCRRRTRQASSKRVLQRPRAVEGRERPGYEPLQEVGEQAAPHHRSEQVARQDGVGARLEVAALGQLVEARLGIVVGGARTGQAGEHRRAEAAAGDRADREHVLGEVRAEVLHARQELGRLVGRIEPAALGGHDVDGIGLAGIAIGRGVLARGEPGLERGLHGRALDVGLLVAELMVVGEAEHLEADQQDDQRAEDRHAEMR